MTVITFSIKMQYVIKKENAFIKNCKCGLFSLVFVVKPGRIMTEIFSAGLQDRQGHEDHVMLKYIISWKVVNWNLF